MCDGRNGAADAVDGDALGGLDGATEGATEDAAEDAAEDRGVAERAGRGGRDDAVELHPAITRTAAIARRHMPACCPSNPGGNL